MVTGTKKRPEPLSGDLTLSAPESDQRRDIDANHRCTMTQRDRTRSGDVVLVDGDASGIRDSDLKLIPQLSVT
jgi:hypothetical protein